MFLLNENETNYVPKAEMYVEASEAGILNVVMESQSELHNLTVSMIRLEHTAVVSENADLLSEGVSAYWDKFIALLKKAWAAVTSFFSGLFEKIKVMFMSVDKFLATYKGELSSANPSDLKMKCFGKTAWAQAPGLIQKASEQAGKLAGMAESGKDAKEMKKEIADGENFGEAFKTQLRGGVSEKTEQAIGSSEVQAALALIENCKKNGNIIKTYKTQIDFVYKKALATAQSGKGAGEGDQEAFDKKARGLKAAGDILNVCVGAMVSVNNELVSDAMAVCKAALSHSRKAAKAAGKEDKKDDAKAEDSVLSQFGF